MAGPGPRNDLTDVAGLRVGQAEDKSVRTGVTVIVCDAPGTASVDVRGGGGEVDGHSPLRFSVLLFLLPQELCDLRRGLLRGPGEASQPVVRFLL